MDSLVGGLKNLIGMLPDLDLTKYLEDAGSKINDYLGYLNWILPIGTIGRIETVWLACIGAYFAFVTLKPLVVKWLKTLL